MKIFLLLFTVAAFAYADQPVPSRISAVTIFADRARITREAVPELPPGVSEITLEPLPAWVNPASIRARIAGGEVLDVSTAKEFLTQTPDEEIRELEAEIQTLQDRMQEIEDLKATLNHAKSQIGQISDFTTRKLPAEALVRDIPVDYFKEMVDYIHSSMTDLNAEIREVMKQQRDLKPEMDALKRKLTEMRRSNQLEQLILTLRVKTEVDGSPKLTVNYELPGATWEVAHDVRIDAQHEVGIVSFGVIRQTTGEDWTDAKITFSTHRPGQGARVPELEAMLLGGKQLVNPQAMGGSSSSSGWTEANRYYLDNNIQFNGLINKGDVAYQQRLKGNWAMQQQTQRQSEVVFAKLKSRGTTALFEAEGVYTVRSDGNPVRVPYAQILEKGELMNMAAPEVSTSAARALDLSYTHSEPLLPGSAALFLEGAYIGNTRLEFTGPGENFVLFAGTEDRLKISRKLNHAESELKRGRRVNEMSVLFEIEVENTGDEALKLKLADRVPVSDQREIKVEAVKTNPRVEVDASGLLFWETEIPAGGSQVFTLSYRVEYPANMNLSRAPQAAGSINAEPWGDPFGGGAPAGDFEIELPAAGSRLQILELEKNF